MTMRPGRAVAKFDAVVDNWFEPLRGHPAADRVFEVASHMGDWSMVWLITTTAQALRSEHDLQRTPRIAGVILGESILVNQGIKRLFRRGRPGDRPLVSERLRVPRTSSFPSGHASSAACTAVLLSEGDPNLRYIVVPIAAVVAASRVHTRMHHPSDVVAGAILGLIIGKTVTTLWPMPHLAKVKSSHK